MPLGEKPECAKCGTQETPLWHHETTDSSSLCNSCFEKNKSNSESDHGNNINNNISTKDNNSNNSSNNNNKSSNNNNNNINNDERSAARKSSRVTRYNGKAKGGPFSGGLKYVPKGKGRRHIFKRTPMKSPAATATPVTSNFVFYKGSYFQVGDIVSMQDIDGGIYYAQIRGLLTDQYCEKSAAVTWLLPTTASPPPEDGFSPETYIIGPEEDLPRKLEYMEFVMHAPSDYYKLKNTPYPPTLDERGTGYIWTSLN